MKIAVVAPTNIPARRANTLQVMKMCQALVNIGQEVRLAAPGSRPAGSDEQIWRELSHHYGVRHPFSIEWLPASPKMRRYDFAWRALRWARHWGAQILYTRLPQAATLSSRLGMATILELHDFPQGRGGPFLFSQFLRGGGASRLVVISKALKDDLALRFPLLASPAFTIHAADGVDLERYADLPSPEQAQRSISARLLLSHGAREGDFPVRFMAGYTGHMYPGRGIEFLLALAARLPEITFLVVGGEPQDVARFQSLAEDQGIKNAILTGFVPNAELPLFQAACHVLLMPYEQRVAASSGGDIARYLSPMKLFEYLACGRAILSSDLPVFREVLSPQIAMLLPPGDLDAWQAALLQLRQDPQLRFSLSTQARSEAQKYTWEKRAARIIEGLQP